MALVPALWVVVTGIAAGALCLRSASDPFSLLAVLFLLWVLSPFAGMLGLVQILRARHLSIASSLPILVPVALLTLASVALYADIVFRPTRSTAALGFLFVPLWSNVVVIVLFGIVSFLVSRDRGSSETDRATKREPKSGA